MKFAFINRILLGAVLIWGVVGCGSSRKVQHITVEPTSSVVFPDSAQLIHIDALLHIPEHFFSVRSRLLIIPKAITLEGDSLLMYLSPIVVDAPIYDKKIERKERLEGYIDPCAGTAVVRRPHKAFVLPFQQTLKVPSGWDQLRVVAAVRTIGCGKCQQGDTLELIRVYDPLALLPDPLTQLRYDWLEPSFEIRPKVRSNRGEAKMQFAINTYDIDVTLGDNRTEITRMLEALQSIISDTLCTLTSVNIVGVASADGSLAYNELLAEKRAQAAINWLQKHLIGLTPAQRKIFSVGSYSEGWHPVLEAMTIANDADSSAVKAILVKYADANEDLQERYIRRLPCWNKIRTQYLQKGRKVEYRYDYTVKSFTSDSQLLAMYEFRPDAFNEEEFLRVSDLKQDSADKMKVYATTLRYFPHSEVAANNLAIGLIRSGEVEAAEQILAELGDSTPAVINTRACLYLYKQDYQRAAELWEQIQQLPQARYNLGLLKVRLNQLQEAYKLLLPFEDLNGAIVALAVGKTKEAEAILARLDGNEPQVQKVRKLLEMTQSTDKF